jgi:hypothetical protein
MSFHFIARLSAIVAVGAVITSHAVADIKGDYKVEFVVQDATYTGTAKAVSAAKGAFTAKFELTVPSNVIVDVTGKTAGDSVTYDAKYEDKGRGCTGTLSGKGTVEKDGSKSAGTLAIDDSCGGALTGTFRLWR